MIDPEWLDKFGRGNDLPLDQRSAVYEWLTAPAGDVWRSQRDILAGNWGWYRLGITSSFRLCGLRYIITGIPMHGRQIMRDVVWFALKIPIYWTIRLTLGWAVRRLKEPTDAK